MISVQPAPANTEAILSNELEVSRAGVVLGSAAEAFDEAGSSSEPAAEGLGSLAGLGRAKGGTKGVVPGLEGRLRESIVRVLCEASLLAACVNGGREVAGKIFCSDFLFICFYFILIGKNGDEGVTGKEATR